MIINAHFDASSVFRLGSNNVILGTVDGLPVRVEYSHDYDLQGEAWVGGACIESIECPKSAAPIKLDREDETLMEALNEADQEHMAVEAGYGSYTKQSLDPVGISPEIHHLYD